MGRANSMDSSRHLDPRVRIIWLVPTAVLILFIWIVGAGFSVFAPDQVSNFSYGIPAILFPIALLILLLTVLGLPSYAWVHMNYINFTYELASGDVVIREGVFTRKRTVIPYGRIQNITTQRTVLERAFGIATLSIETAGTNPGVSEGILPGISEYEKVIGEIMEHVETKRRSSGLSAADEAAGATENGGVMMQVLNELRETNRLLRESLLRQKHERHAESPLEPDLRRKGKAE